MTGRLTDRSFPLFDNNPIEHIGIMGSGGNFGMFVTSRIRHHLSWIPVRSFDAHKQSTHTREEVASSDIVILAVPISQFEKTVAEIVPLLGPTSIIIDICTVKEHTIDVLRRLMGDRSYWSGHPLFGPMTWEDNGHRLDGLEIVECAHTLSDQALSASRKLFYQLGLSVVEMSAEEHDREVAGELLLVQLLGRIIKRAGFRRSSADAHTRSAVHFFTAMEIVAGDEKLFEEVCAHNRFCRQLVERFFEASDKVRAQYEF